MHDAYPCNAHTCACVLQNVLIAVLSDSFELTQEQAPAALLQLRTEICVEILEMMPQNMRHRVEERNRALHVLLPDTEVR